MKIVLATRNRGKIREIEKLAPGVELLTLESFPGLKMPPETGLTFSENAVAKARIVAEGAGLPAIADDSGLEVDALGGRPGVFSARYAGADATDEKNYLKLLAEMKGIPMDGRSARFRCVIALAFPHGKGTFTFDGVLDGFITTEPKGENGFGYDPVFFLPEMGRTAAELTLEEKNAISHRAMALKKLRGFLADLKGPLFD